MIPRCCVRRWRSAAFLMLSLFNATSAQAGACTLSSSGMVFGAYQPITFNGKLLSADRTSDATVSLVCTGITVGGSYSISLGPSTVGGSTNPRYLANGNGGPPMAFNVYRDAAYSSVWGDGITGAQVTGAIPLGDSSQSQTVFGRVAAGQRTLKPGSFSGTLAMTVTYNP